MARGSSVEARVVAMGAQGDGIAEAGGERFYVPFTVPDDVVRLKPGPRKGEGRAAALVEVISSGPGRGAPACRHFGVCGGCALQHLDEAAYAAFKRDQVSRALSHQGLGHVDVAEPLIVPRGARRRTRLTARLAGKQVRLGYLERASHNLVDVRECPVLVPELEALIGSLRDLLAAVLGPKDSVQISLAATGTGIDMVIEASGAPSLAMLEGLAAFAGTHDLARIGWQSGQGYEPVAERRRPMVMFGEIAVPVPPGAFLQATAESEAWMIDMAREATAGAASIADLFAGCGTFAVGLADRAEITAFEGDGAALEACRQGLNHAQGLRPVHLRKRDLFREPLSPQELSPFDAVVIDPPRAGARDQSAALAQSSVPRIMAFSCNPGTFARDARALVDGGYRLDRVTPIDQFRWSAQVELAALFTRD
jgi:23S rRNA (uracil1939-C5)-methyltransferase